jgi:hypothetical protein
MQVSAFARGRDHAEHTVRQRPVRFRVQPDGGNLRRSRNGRRPVADAVRHAADHARWPLRLAVRAARDRERGNAQLRERRPRTRAHRRELPLPPFDRARQSSLLFGKKHPVQQVAECLCDGHRRRQDLCEHLKPKVW